MEQLQRVAAHIYEISCCLDADSNLTCLRHDPRRDAHSVGER